MTPAGVAEDWSADKNVESLSQSSSTHGAEKWQLVDFASVMQEMEVSWPFPSFPVATTSHSSIDMYQGCSSCMFTP